MSDTEAAFLAAIVENPDDNHVRLVYADWLEEQEYSTPREAEVARARAAFIRLEIEMAGMMVDRDSEPADWEQPRFYELKARASALYDRHRRDWFGNLDRLTAVSRTHRGCVNHIALSARKFIANGEEIYRLAPTIGTVLIGQLGRNMPSLAGCPALRHVRELAFFGSPVCGREAEHLATSPFLGNLRVLTIRGVRNAQIGARGARALARAETLTALERLDLSSHRIGDEGAIAIIKNRQFGKLRRLALSNNRLFDDTADALADADHLTRLADLDLAFNHLHPDGLRRICRAPHLAGLEHLWLQENPLGDEGAAIVASGGFTRLKDLWLGDCRLTDRGCATLFASPVPAGLQRLDLCNNRPGERAFRALATAGHSPLAWLSVERCEIGPMEAGMLGRVATLPVMQSLFLDDNPLGVEGIRRLLRGPLARSLERLDLVGCQLGDDGAEALASCLALANLRILILHDNGITDRGALALVRSRRLSGLRSLYLDFDRLRKQTKAAGRERFGEKGGWL
jgi:uncharacterized protein (TIGR02996 family)